MDFGWGLFLNRAGGSFTGVGPMNALVPREKEKNRPSLNYKYSDPYNSSLDACPQETLPPSVEANAPLNGGLPLSPRHYVWRSADLRACVADCFFNVHHVHHMSRRSTKRTTPTSPTPLYTNTFKPLHQYTIRYIPTTHYCILHTYTYHLSIYRKGRRPEEKRCVLAFFPYMCVKDDTPKK
jgi:hypothetical protein